MHTEDTAERARAARKQWRDDMQREDERLRQSLEALANRRRQAKAPGNNREREEAAGE